MTVVDRMMRHIDKSVRSLRAGLDPDELSFWYGVIVRDALDIAPPWLQGKIKVEQDPILSMRFKLDISRRAVRYFMIAVEKNRSEMPYSTGLYFLKVQERLETEMNKSLV